MILRFQFNICFTNLKKNHSHNKVRKELNSRKTQFFKKKLNTSVECLEDRVNDSIVEEAALRITININSYMYER